MDFINNIFNYFTDSPKPIDQKFRVDFTGAFDNEEFTKLVGVASANHGTNLDFMFPKTSLGLIQALYVGSINGNYWSNKSITEKCEKEVTMTNKQIDNMHTNKQNDVKIHELRKSFYIPKENQVYHIHLSGSQSLSDDQINNLKTYWSTVRNKTLSAVVTLYGINDRDDIYDMRHGIYHKLNSELGTEFCGYSTHSVSVGDDCNIHSAFRAGSTFRHHGRTKDITYFMFNSDNIPCKIENLS